MRRNCFKIRFHTTPTEIERNFRLSGPAVMQEARLSTLIDQTDTRMRRRS